MHGCCTPPVLPHPPLVRVTKNSESNGYVFEPGSARRRPAPSKAPDSARKPSLVSAADASTAAAAVAAAPVAAAPSALGFAPTVRPTTAANAIDDLPVGPKAKERTLGGGRAAMNITDGKCTRASGCRCPTCSVAGVLLTAPGG